MLYLFSIVEIQKTEAGEIKINAIGGANRKRRRKRAAPEVEEIEEDPESSGTSDQSSSEDDDDEAISKDKPMSAEMQVEVANESLVTEKKEVPGREAEKVAGDMLMIKKVASTTHLKTVTTVPPKKALVVPVFRTKEIEVCLI